MIEMYELDGSSLGGDIYHFTQHDMYGFPIIWAGITYTPFPIQATGFERRAQGAQSRPKLIISNVGGFLGAICRTTDDLIGTKVTRIRTFKKYLDAINFTPAVNPTANPNIELPREVWRIDRRAGENRDAISFELCAPWDLVGVKLPKRIVIQSACWWVYRSAECGYAGPPVATASDAATNVAALDVCGKRTSSCKKRFGATAELPFGGFPGVGQTTIGS
jgi:lambda family phage minor tail protein L